MVCTAEWLHWYLSSMQPAVAFVTFLRIQDPLCYHNPVLYVSSGPRYSCERTLAQKQMRYVLLQLPCSLREPFKKGPFGERHSLFVCYITSLVHMLTEYLE